jgi:hypothetical protein
LHVPDINNEVERELSSISIASVSSRFEFSAVFCTDESKGEAGTGFGVYQLNGSEISFHLREPSNVFTSELPAICMALVQIKGQFIIL